MLLYWHKKINSQFNDTDWGAWIEEFGLMAKSRLKRVFNDVYVSLMQSMTLKV